MKNNLKLKALITMLFMAFFLILRAGNVSIGGIRYELNTNDNTATVAGCSSTSTSLDIPGTIEYNGTTFRVTAVRNDAFQYNKLLTSVTFGNELKEIGTYAFYECTGLTRISFASSIKSIEDFAFYGCTSVTSVSFPTNCDLQSIGNCAFYNCKALTAFKCPKSVSNIGVSAFENCSKLVTITLGEGLKRIRESTFSGDVALTDMVIPEGVTCIEKKAFYNCEGIVTYRLPNTLDSICNDVFKNNDGLVRISIPGSVRYIGTDCFSGCSNLSNVRFEDGYNYCTVNSVFQAQPIKSVYIGRDLIYGRHKHPVYPTLYGDVESPFQGMESINRVTFSQNGYVTYIGKYLFYGCNNIKEIKLPQSLQSIGDHAFGEIYKLADIDISDRVGYIGDYCFAGDSALARVKLSSNLKKLSSHLFFNCGALKSISIPANITTIEDAVFAGCTTLDSIGTINAVNINDSAFNSCRRLSEITFSNRTQTIGEKVFDGCYSLKKLIFSDGSSTLNIGSTFESSQISTLYLGRNLSYNMWGTDSPFSYDYNLKNLNIGDSVTKLGDYAFFKCRLLDNVVLPNNIVSIGKASFEGCTSLKKLTFSQNMASIGEESFMDCKSLEKVELPSSMDALPSQAFANCTSLSTVILDENLNTIGPSAFKGCTRLKGIVIPKNVYGFGVESFSGCTSLQFINLTEGIKSIGKGAFNGCIGLEGVEFSKNLVSIGDGAFTNCSALTTIRSWAEIPPEGLPDFPENVYKNAVVYAPKASLNDYKESSTWEKFFKFSAISDDIKIIKITLNKKVLNLKVNETDSLKAETEPAFASNNKIKWISKAETVAVVDSVGIVKGLSVGTTQIIAEATDGSNVSDTCLVSVLPVVVNDIKLDTTNVDIKKGQKYQLHAIILPVDATDKSIKWYSSDSTICSVSQNGELTAVATGECTIKAVPSSNESLHAECTVTVTQDADSVIISEKELDLNVEETKQLSAFVLPNDATDKSVKWLSTNNDVVVVDEKGLVTATGNGKALIIVSARNGELKDTCKVSVTTSVSSIIINESIVNLKIGETKQLSVTVLPSSASNKDVVWSTSDEGVCAVSQSGLLKALSVGNSLIIVRSASNSDIYALCSVDVTGETTCIEQINAEASLIGLEIYNVRGQRIPKLTRGVNIIKKDGMVVRKVIVK